MPSRGSHKSEKEAEFSTLQSAVFRLPCLFASLRKRHGCNLNVAFSHPCNTASEKVDVTDCIVILVSVNEDIFHASRSDQFLTEKLC